MASGRVQLEAIGAQDSFLTGNPEITYFQKVYKKHTKFALELLDNNFDNTDIVYGSTARCTIARKGDLIRNMYLRIELPSIPSNSGQDIGYTESVGHALIEYADLIIGGQTVQRITGEYMEIYNELFTSDSQQNSLKFMIGKTQNGRTGLGPAIASAAIDSVLGAYPKMFFIPLPFYFTRQDSLDIPLSAIQRQEVEVEIKFRKLEEIVVAGSADDPTDFETVLANISRQVNATIPVEYVFLEEREVQHMRETPTDYLISQLQLSRAVVDSETTSQSFRLEFVNPVKEMFICIQDQDRVETNLYTGNDWFNYDSAYSQASNNVINHQLASMELLFNNELAVDSSVADTLFLFNIQPMTRHTRSPNKRKFYTYSFAIDPENHYPTGQVNMSRIQNKVLRLNFNPNTKSRDVRVYAISYNILRIQDGIAGLLFTENNTYK